MQVKGDGLAPRPGRDTRRAGVVGAGKAAYPHHTPIPGHRRWLHRLHPRRRTRRRHPGHLARRIHRPDALPVRFLRIRPAGRRIPRDTDGTLPVQWLIAQWPDQESEPVKYWLASLPADTDPADLVRLGKIRWRIEHDYRELKTGLGLDHFEGRSWTGWHRHVTLVTAAHLFITMLSTRPKSGCAGLTLYRIIRGLQQLLATWTGACPTCKQNTKPLHRNTFRLT